MNGGFSRLPRWARGSLVAGAAALGMTLAAGGADAGPIRDFLFGKSRESAPPPNALTLDPEYFLQSQYCPPVQITVGAQALPVYERNHDGEAGFIRYQGAITETARECHTDTETGVMTVKVGIAGRVVAGPKGGVAANVTLPLRVAVIRQDGSKVFFNKAVPVAVKLAAPDFGAGFQQVVDKVTFKVAPDDRDLVVYVGFDQGKKQGAPTG
jgi:hypothetical protein